ncbi:nucleoside/nucleotide kinase family protein [Butyrivibrio sp.]|uniref:nucleoside/nucleotide kinase family protein n=1 Tax=Butyrivibrio sp. TaxID=28121 RepID=UPI0025C434AD|nr:nucleoside/nucleotide kinase family protein [Butyrivibrio sp.]MBQ9301528.1 nucleoside/nucleotide kinase family protein [Butyrivibrio sp.]
MEYNVNINGIDVEATYSKEAIEGIVRPLLERMGKKHDSEKRRILVMLAAPPGAGKSTLVSFLEHMAKEIIPTKKVQAVGMDGFHRRQEYLTSHTTIVDGKEIPMVDIKGAPITFDLEALKNKIIELKGNAVCKWPEYNRMLHNPVEDAIAVDADIVLLEGNYLLLDQDGWRDISEYADYTISMTAEPQMLRKRLIDRKTASGNTREKAEKFVDFSDMANVKICLEHSKKADMELKIDEDGNLHRQDSN